MKRLNDTNNSYNNLKHLNVEEKLLLLKTLLKEYSHNFSTMY